ncbi:hypothetical protein AX774_g5225 [Zancudomyces culisetae]|uniref:E3 ubiquitin-protein ligase synoviolin-like TPR repeats domain-containing protein n=1 Tax=Zancudomyces culisetae TaxID=1213189 RepID=A0A1R1PKA3_ZANCU|nr:hypothetical protein AX774_g5225 [Zancudomyces culisetae]|eukprot:OMH81312.1 hypothetical protein AX774_g5225 [Zancudomyces culisetae]
MFSGGTFKPLSLIFVVGMLFTKVFHWLLQERMEYIEQRTIMDKKEITRVLLYRRVHAGEDEWERAYGQPCNNNAAYGL